MVVLADLARCRTGKLDFRRQRLNPTNDQQMMREWSGIKTYHDANCSSKECALLSSSETGRSNQPA